MYLFIYNKRKLVCLYGSSITLLVEYMISLSRVGEEGQIPSQAEWSPPEGETNRINDYRIEMFGVWPLSLKGTTLSLQYNINQISIYQRIDVQSWGSMQPEWLSHVTSSDQHTNKKQNWGHNKKGQGQGKGLWPHPPKTIPILGIVLLLPLW